MVAKAKKVHIVQILPLFSDKSHSVLPLAFSGSCLMPAILWIKGKLEMRNVYL